MKELEEIRRLITITPNDTLLGGEIRKYIDSIDSNKNSFILCIKCGKWQSRINHKCSHCNEQI